MRRLALLGCACAGSAAFAFASCSAFSGSSAAEDAGKTDSSDVADTNSADSFSLPDGEVSPEGGSTADAGFLDCNDAGVCTLAFGLNNPSSLTVNDSFVYVTENVTSGNVFAIPKGGGGKKQIYEGANPCSIRVVGTLAYFAVTNERVVRIAGTSTKATFNLPFFLEADDAGVLVADTQQACASLAPDLTLMTEQTQATSSLTGVALSPTYFFFALGGAGTGTVIRQDRPNFSSQSSYGGYTFQTPGVMLATSDSTVYVAEEGMNRVIQIDGVNFAGTPTPIATELAIPSALAVDSTWLYVADANGIQKSDLLTHGQSPLLAMPNVSAITQDDLYVYFSVRGTSADDGGPIAPSTGYVGASRSDATSTVAPKQRHPGTSRDRASDGVSRMRV